MRTIPLTRGLFTIVDDADYEVLSQHKWYASRGSKDNCYAARKHRHENGLRHLILMHRFIMASPDGVFVDHIDGNPLNNCRDNLRHATPANNAMNSRPQRGRSSAFKGVFWDGSSHNRLKWRAGIRVNGRAIYLGRFPNEESAAQAYECAAKKYFGQFYRPQ